MPEAATTETNRVKNAACEAVRLPAAERMARARARDRRLETLGDEIARLSAQIQAATYRMLVMLRDFDEEEGWNQGFRSCAHWLAWRTGIGLGAAREKVRVARALHGLPKIGAAMERGKISFSKVRALTRIATASNEQELLDIALACQAAHLERLVRAWRRADRVEDQAETSRRHLERSVVSYTDEDGMVVLRARLEPEAGAVVLRALEAATEKLWEAAKLDPKRMDGLDATRPSFEQRRADGLALVAESALEAGLDPGTRGDRYQVVLHVDQDRLADSALEGDGDGRGKDGQSAIEEVGRVSAETCRRIACDSSLVEMKRDGEGKIFDVGRKTRVVPTPLRRALERRDKGCRFPGCTNKVCDAHHLEHWADGGETKLSNLLLLCRTHHRLVHEEGYRIELDPEGAVQCRAPRGTWIPVVPLAPAVGKEPVEELRARTEEEGIEIGPWTAPVWQGDRFDLDFIMMWSYRR